MLLFFSLNLILLHELQDMKDKEVGPVVRFYLPTRTVPWGQTPDIGCLVQRSWWQVGADTRGKAWTVSKLKGRRFGTQWETVAKRWISRIALFLKSSWPAREKVFIVLPITWLLMEASYLNNSLLSLCCTRAMCKINEDWAVEYCSTFY